MNGETVSSLAARMPLVAAVSWSEASVALGVLTPLIIVPLGVITFYLRGLREQQRASQADLSRRIERLDEAQRSMAGQLIEFEREFTVKEDWLRESMLARRNLERLTEAFARLQGTIDALVETDRPLVRTHGRDSQPLSPTDRGGSATVQET